MSRESGNTSDWDGTISRTRPLRQWQCSKGHTWKGELFTVHFDWISDQVVQTKPLCPFCLKELIDALPLGIVSEEEST